MTAPDGFGFRNKATIAWSGSTRRIPSIPINPAADGVLGQPDFTSNGCSLLATQNRMCYPYGLAISSNDTLFVADGNLPPPIGVGNNRVLRFDQASDKANGANADGVLGQPDFTSIASAVTQNGMANPRGVALREPHCLLPKGKITECCVSTTPRVNPTGPTPTACWASLILPPTPRP